MKTIKLLLSVVLLTFASNTFADNLAVEDFTIAPGSTKTISIELNNPNSEYIMVEFWLSLPNGLTIPKDEDDYYLAEGNSSRFKRSHTLEVSKQDGYYHFLIYSSRNEALKGNSGELISVTIEAASNAQIGTYTANIFNQLYNDPSKMRSYPMMCHSTSPYRVRLRTTSPLSSPTKEPPPTTRLTTLTSVPYQDSRHTWPTITIATMQRYRCRLWMMRLQERGYI